MFSVYLRWTGVTVVVGHCDSKLCVSVHTGSATPWHATLLAVEKPGRLAKSDPSRLWKSLGTFFIFLFIILLLLGGHHSLFSCSGELPVVNSSAGSTAALVTASRRCRPSSKSSRPCGNWCRFRQVPQIRPQREDLQWGCSLCFDYAVPPHLAVSPARFPLYIYIYNLFLKMFMEV